MPPSWTAEKREEAELLAEERVMSGDAAMEEYIDLGIERRRGGIEEEALAAVEREMMLAAACAGQQIPVKVLPRTPGPIQTIPGLRINEYLTETLQLICSSSVTGIIAPTGTGKTAGVPPAVCTQLGVTVWVTVPNRSSTRIYSWVQEHFPKLSIGWAAHGQRDYRSDTDVVYMTTGHMYLKLLHMLTRIRQMETDARRRAREGEAKFRAQEATEAAAAAEAVDHAERLADGLATKPLPGPGEVSVTAAMAGARVLAEAAAKAASAVGVMNRSKLPGVLMVDETHHPSVENYALLKLLRYVRRSHPALIPRLLVSSATFGVEAFVEDFNDARMQQIPIEAYPVEVIYLEVRGIGTGGQCWRCGRPGGVDGLVAAWEGMMRQCARGRARRLWACLFFALSALPTTPNAVAFSRPPPPACTAAPAAPPCPPAPPPNCLPPPPVRSNRSTTRRSC